MPEWDHQDLVGPKVSLGANFGTELHSAAAGICSRDGSVFCSDSRGGITTIGADGIQGFRGVPDPRRFKPNGIALLRDGSLIFANHGEEGGIWSIASDNRVAPVVNNMSSQIPGAVNFVLAASDGSIWFSVQTTAGMHARLTATDTDGYLARIEDAKVTIMADRLNWANEFKIDAERSVLYVNETFAQRTTAFDIGADNALTNRRVLTAYGPGTYPDGLTLDAEGHLWITSIVSNRIMRVSPEGDVRLVYDDADPKRVDAAEQALRDGAITREFIYTDTGAVLNNPTSLAFGGDDLRKAYVGSLGHSELRTFQSPVSGMPPAHWNW